VADTVRTHRVSTAVWVLAGGLTMYGMALAIAVEMKDFPGGSQALAASIYPSAEAMRPMRWPAERLDTLGGYIHVPQRHPVQPDSRDLRRSPGRPGHPGR